jgi:NADH-quinone oxidoreductase subunit A
LAAGMENYFPILMFVLVGVAVGVLPVAMGFILAPSRPDPEKLSPYECGFEAFEDARMKFDVRFYLVAILFILFDLEIAFLFPWAAIFKDIVATESIKLFGFVEMLVFVAILVIGYIYAWAKGALEWE